MVKLDGVNMNPWNWIRFIKTKTMLFAVGILIGIIGTLIYLKVDFSKLLDLPDIETIPAWTPVIAASSTVILAIITGVYVFITRSMLNEQRKTINRERLSKEMDLVVAPLTQRKGDMSKYFFDVKEKRVHLVWGTSYCQLWQHL